MGSVGDTTQENESVEGTSSETLSLSKPTSRYQKHAGVRVGHQTGLSGAGTTLKKANPLISETSLLLAGEVDLVKRLILSAARERAELGSKGVSGGSSKKCGGYPPFTA
jgi:hypothetical protein